MCVGKEPKATLGKRVRKESKGHPTPSRESLDNPERLDPGATSVTAVPLAYVDPQDHPDLYSRQTSKGNQVTLDHGGLTEPKVILACQAPPAELLSQGSEVTKEIQEELDYLGHVELRERGGHSAFLGSMAFPATKVVKGTRA